MKKISVFLFALLLGLATVAPNVFATSYDPTGGAGNLPDQPKTALINNMGKTGDALFGELYRAIAPSDDAFFGKSNVATYVSIENVSGRWVAAHVRLRTGRFSIEAIDFPILLSPHDVFWFQFQTIGTDGTQVVTIFSADTKTILYSGLDTYKPRLGDVVYNPATGSVTMTLKTTLLEQFGPLAAQYKLPDELTMGHIEVFGLFSLSFPTGRKPAAGDNFFSIMGQLMGDDFGACLDGGILCANRYASYHENGLTFADRRVPALDVGKDLTGHVFIGDFSTGIYAGYTMKAFKDFRAGVGLDGGLPAGCSNANPANVCINPIAHRDLFIRGIFNNGGVLVNPATILYSYASDKAYLEPDWTTSFGPTWNDGDNWYGDPLALSAGETPSAAGLKQIASVRSFSLDEVEDALYKRVVSSTYFNTGFSGETFTMGVLTFPTKYAHYFFNSGSGLSSTGRYLSAWPVGSSSGATSARAPLNPANMSKIGCDVGVWDLEEGGPKDPSVLPSILLPWETNLVPIGDQSVIKLAGFGFLVADDIDSLLVRADQGFKYGWFLLRDFFLTSGDPRCGSSSYDPNTNVASDPAYKAPVCSGNQINYTVPGDLLPSITGYYLLSPTTYDPLAYKMPVSVLMIDFEGTSYPHLRMYEPSWDNNTDSDGLLGGIGGVSDAVVPNGSSLGYGG